MRDATLEPVDPEERPVEKSHLGFPVVGIGASAGGVQALQTLFENMPASMGMAFIVVMHLSPTHESSLAAILQRCTRMPVVEATSSVLIEADHVYVISPAKQLRMNDGQLIVGDAVPTVGRRAAIDVFFRTLAQAHQERAVGLLLSGAGSDGTQGLKRLKELGGVAIAQAPGDAEFESMPCSAIAAGLVDFALPVADIPQKLVELWQNARGLRMPNPPPDMEVVPADDVARAEEALKGIKALLRERTGHDFAHYKRATILRRLERRMQVTFTADLPAYLELLRSNVDETAPLLQDMLISVTQFFRDRKAFEALERELMAHPPESSGDPTRAWVVGCATGEEAYSVAMLLNDALGSRPQVFATDIDQRAIDVARKAIYPESIMTDVPPASLRLHFDHESSVYRVAKPIRDAVLFSIHNALRDPPFSRVDLICCRNLLIYLSREGQAQLLRAFHFALNPGGLLFLGSAETAEFPEGLFAAVDKRQRLYRALPSARSRRQTSLPSIAVPPAAAAPPVRSKTVVRKALDPIDDRQAQALAELAPASVLINAQHDMLQISPSATGLLRVASGTPSTDLFDAVLPELRAELRATLYRARESALLARSGPIALVVNGDPRSVVITARPSRSKETEGLMLVVFDHADASSGTGGAARSEPDPAMAALEAEARGLQQTLAENVEEAAASTEELKAANEELQSINEELRSATEELETSREEAQSVNEELSTVNHELRAHIEESDKVNDDLRNLIASTDIGTVFVDRGLRVKRFTPRAGALFSLIEADIGRSLLDITHRLDYPALATDLDDVFKTLRETEREVRSQDGRWFLARALPYRTAEDRIDGAILNFIDITARRQAEQMLHESERRMLLVAESMRDYAIITMGVDGRITSWNAGAERMFGFSDQEAMGQPFDLIFTPEDVAAGAPAQELATARRIGRSEDERWHRRKDGSTFFCSGVTTTIGEGELIGYAKIGRDVTSIKVEESRRETALRQELAKRTQLEESSVMKDEFLAVMSHELKNPLNLIQLHAELMARLPRATNPAAVAKAAGVIQRAVATQAQIIDDLLDLSRVNTGKLAIAPSRVELAPVIERIVEALRPDAVKHGQSLTSKVEPTVALWADPVRVEQIIWNLLTNAAKFTPNNGSISVAVCLEDRFALIEVTDTGIGLALEDQDRVFGMFQQVERGRTRSGGGLGIGLALVKRLAELHGGRVEASSPGVGLGTTFKVWMPLDSGHDSSPEQEKEVSGLRDMSILLVDDEPDMLAAFGELLQMNGATVETADNAASALELAAAKSFDLVLSDINMPGKDGYWLIGKLRGLPNGNDLPAIAVSGRTRPADREQAIEAGFNSHLGKPINFDALAVEVARLRATDTS